MAEILIREIKEEQELSVLAPMVKQMYRELDAFGLMLPLDDDGAEKWIRSIRLTLGKMAVVLVAHRDGRPVGFAHGALRFLPDYLGKHLTGVITHIFVERDCRRHGTAGDLLHALEEWFRSKAVHSIDLEVVEGNSPATAFWKRKGYLPEFTQYRKIVK